ncbi:MAG: hypothetical protein K2W97_01705 [Chthoniobacterales bacterium]|nr:hypothetical protein [Chthoniobacterales bacterium]
MSQANAAEKTVLNASQVLDCAKQLLATFSSSEDSSALLTEEVLTDSIKKEAGDSKTSQLLVATKLRDLVSSSMQTRRSMASRIPRDQMGSYARETEKLQNFFKTIEVVLGKFGSPIQK